MAPSDGINKSNNNNTWFTTKKRGRDDDVIERDRKRALDERKKKKRSNSINTTNKPKKKTSKTNKTSRSGSSKRRTSMKKKKPAAAPKSKKDGTNDSDDVDDYDCSSEEFEEESSNSSAFSDANQEYWSSSDSGGSMADFLAKDDDDDLQEQLSDVDNNNNSKRNKILKNKPPANKNKKTSSSRYFDNDDDDDMFGDNESSSSSPSKQQQQKGSSSSLTHHRSSFTPRATARQLLRKKKMEKKQQQQVGNDEIVTVHSSSEEEDERDENDDDDAEKKPPSLKTSKNANHRPSRRQQKPTGSSSNGDDFIDLFEMNTTDDDDDSKQRLPLRKRNKQQSSHSANVTEKRPPALSSQFLKSIIADKKHGHADDSSTDDSVLMTPARRRRKKDSNNKSSRYFNTDKKQGENKVDLDDEKEDDDDVSSPLHQHGHRPGGKKKSNNKPEKKRRVVVDDNEDDDGDDSAVLAVDEYLALEKAMKDSLKEQKKRKPKKALSLHDNNKTTTKEEDGLFDTDQEDNDMEDKGVALKKWAVKQEKPKKKKKAESLHDSRNNTSEEEGGEGLFDAELEDEVSEDDDGRDEAYQDEAAKAAGSVLDTANQLSAQVLATMTKWSGVSSSSSNEDSNNNNGIVVPMGMIVDGAIALSSMETHNSLLAAQAGGGGISDNDDKNARAWISRDLLEELCPNVTLAEYQLIGVNWLALMHSLTGKVSISGGSGSRCYNVNGVLADEMGLGKTVQTIVFLRYLKYANSRQDPESVQLPHLVVAPSSVLDNWEREFQNFAPDLHVVKYHGSLQERMDLKEQLYAHLSTKNLHQQRQLDVILAPITYFQHEKTDDRNFLRKFQYEYLVVDEAHVLKNSRGNRYTSLDRFQSKHRLLLTGTPVQNNPKELMALLSFLMPLFSKKSSNAFGGSEEGHDGGESMLQHFVTLKGRDGGSDEAAYRKLKQLFAPFVLRRKKVDVLAQIIPPKHQQVEFVELNCHARGIYDSIIAEHVQQKKIGNSALREHLFTQLRKAAHHPLLLRTRYKSQSEKDHLARCFQQYGAFRGEGCTRERVADELERFNDFDIHLMAHELLAENPHRHEDLQRYILDEQDLFCSAKFVRLQSLLPELTKAGHRILIFSVWTNCLDLLSCLMDHLGLQYRRMEGSTPVSERQALIDEFNKDASIPVFLLSTKACGLGINLTSADTCIMHDLDFNPFNDRQAEDRCHRIGQKKPVTVYKLVTKATVDEDIYAIQERKAKMNAAIMEKSTADWDSAKEKKAVLHAAVDRFLRSPHQQPSPGSAEKENSSPTTELSELV